IMNDTVKPTEFNTTTATPVAPAAAPAAVVAAPVVAAPVAAAKPVVAIKAAAPAVKVAAKPVAKPVAKKAAAKPVAKKAVAKKVAAPVAVKPAAKPAAKKAAVEAAPMFSNLINRVKKETNMATTKLETTAETVKAKLAEGVETMTSQSKAAFEQASTKAREALDKGVKGLEEVSTMNRDNVEAMMASGRIAAKGFETIGKHFAEVSKKNWDANVSAIKSIRGLKSPTEVFKFQAEFAKSQFDAAIADMSKLTETVVKIAGEVAEPIQNRVALTVDKVSKSVAAK
ncbi:MAG: phasin family protein, partial [Polymorphobacter sp.]